MRSEYAGALAVFAGVVVVFLLGWAIQGCGDGHDLVKLDAAPVALTASCAPTMPPDAGPDADCWLNPLGGAGGCP